MKIYIFAIISLVLFIWILNPVITLNPFTIKFESLLFSTGLLLFIIGFSLMLHDVRRKAFEQGAKKMQDAVVEYINTLKDE